MGGALGSEVLRTVNARREMLTGPLSKPLRPAVPGCVSRKACADGTNSKCREVRVGSSESDEVWRRAIIRK